MPRRFNAFTKFFTEFAKAIWITREIHLVLLLAILALGILFSTIENLKIGESIYFSFITALTVGYGDIVPTTSLGRLLSIAIGCIGIVYFGIIIAIATLSVKKSVSLHMDKR